jgi:hypothetical protein
MPKAKLRKRLLAQFLKAVDYILIHVILQNRLCKVYGQIHKLLFGINLIDALNGSLHNFCVI